MKGRDDDRTHSATKSDLAVLFLDLRRSDGYARILVGPSGAIINLNARAEALFGYAAAELIQQDIVTLIPPRFRASHDALHHAYLEDPRERPMGNGRYLYGLRKDGTEFEVEIGLIPAKSDAGAFTLVVLRPLNEDPVQR